MKPFTLTLEVSWHAPEKSQWHTGYVAYDGRTQHFSLWLGRLCLVLTTPCNKPVPSDDERWNTLLAAARAAR